MKGKFSHLTAAVAAGALVATPIAVQANTRAPDTSTYSSQGGDDDDGAAGLLLGGESNLSGSDLLLALFGTLGVIGAIAILVSGKSSGDNPRRPTEEPDVPVQSNGAT
ncbi:MAG: hypothetical protein C0510_05920 [Erythrobacter sp.]|nr:hypothetical protein [Erythrobacter sp.]